MAFTLTLSAFVVGCLFFFPSSSSACFILSCTRDTEGHQWFDKEFFYLEAGDVSGLWLSLSLDKVTFSLWVTLTTTTTLSDRTHVNTTLLDLQWEINYQKKNAYSTQHDALNGNLFLQYLVHMHHPMVKPQHCSPSFSSNWHCTQDVKASTLQFRDNRHLCACV